jgi:hypothetical protein
MYPVSKKYVALDAGAFHVLYLPKTFGVDDGLLLFLFEFELELFERPPPLGLPVVEGHPPPLPCPVMLVALGILTIFSQLSQ